MGPDFRVNMSRARAVALLVVTAAFALICYHALTRWQVERGGDTSSMALDPRLRLRAAMQELARAGTTGKPSEAQIAAAVGVAKSAPLLAEPFLVAALAEDDAGHGERATQLLLAARARDPRLPVTRYLLGDRYRQNGKDDLALAELMVLMRVQPQRQMSLLPYFAQLATQRRYQPAIRGLVLADPGFGRMLLGAAANEGASADFLISVGRQLPPHPENRAWQERLIAKPLERGDYGAARRRWQAIAGTAAQPMMLRFDDRTSPAPFNWTFADSADGVAEPQGQDHLSLLYYGRNPLALATQVATLAPGRYRLSWQIDGSEGAGSTLSWRVSCLPDGSVTESRLSTLSIELAVDDRCLAQRVELLGTPSAAGSRQSIALSSLKLVRLP